MTKTKKPRSKTYNPLKTKAAQCMAKMVVDEAKLAGVTLSHDALKHAVLKERDATFAHGALNSIKRCEPLQDADADEYQALVIRCFDAVDSGESPDSADVFFLIKSIEMLATAARVEGAQYQVDKCERALTALEAVKVNQTIKGVYRFAAGQKALVEDALNDFLTRLLPYASAIQLRCLGAYVDENDYAVRIKGVAA